MTNMNVYTGASSTQQTLFDEIRTLQNSFYGLFPALYYRSTLNDHFVFVIGVWY